MKLRLTLVSAVTLGVLLSMPAAAQMPTMTPFSSDFQVTNKTGEDVHGKLYFTSKHMRMDMEGSPRGEIIMITDTTAQTSDMLMPAQHMYMEFKSDQSMGRRPGMAPNIKAFHDPSNPCADEQGATCKNLGVEQVNGRTCDHWQITKKDGSVSNVWIDQKLHFPIKAESKTDTWQLTNIKEGEQDASLFAIPAGYRKMDINGMMGGMQRPGQ